MEFFAGAFLQANGAAEVYDHFGSGDALGVDDLGFSDEADAVTGYGDGGGFGGEERQGVRIFFEAEAMCAFSDSRSFEKTFAQDGSGLLYILLKQAGILQAICFLSGLRRGRCCFLWL